jgi:phosphatidylethanolamine/phosphatidyl-N-methylethanolamine N-methyltransferase
LKNLVFLREFFRAPKRIGSVTPSSSVLAKLMIDAADIKEGHVVVELGAGTGPFTKEIVSRHPDVAFMAIEPRQHLAQVLREEFPSLQVQEAWAQELPQLTASWGHPTVDRVVSGLPWALWPQALQEEILSALVASMAPTGKFVTFTYLHSGVMPGARRFRKNLNAYFGTVRTTQVAWLNFPPAYAFVCEDAR